MLKAPLAERMRPQSLKDVVGQTELLANGAILQQIIKSKEPTNLIFWGPPGSGKTTLARLIAKETKAEFMEISAVTNNKKDVTNIIEHARQNWNLKIRTILFVDEIHRFNKAQQDAFLPHVESGLITLIGATTENPSFEIIRPLLSRSHVLVLKPLSKEQLKTILKKALRLEKSSQNVTPRALDYLAEIAGGDARIALNTLELALLLNPKVTLETAKTATQKQLPAYDKKGDNHYEVISAFIKSMRGGDATATLYYMARMIQAGEDPKFIARRMVIFASEDIGLAGNGALGLAVNAFLATERIGLPEASIILSHTAIALTKSKKSRDSYNALKEAQVLAEQYPNLPIPLHLRNASTKLMGDLGYGKDYEWQAGFKHQQGFLPEEIKNKKII